MDVKDREVKRNVFIFLHPAIFHSPRSILPHFILPGPSCHLSFSPVHPATFHSPQSILPPFILIRESGFYSDLSTYIQRYFSPIQPTYRDIFLQFNLHTEKFLSNSTYIQRYFSPIQNTYRDISLQFNLHREIFLSNSTFLLRYFLNSNINVEIILQSSYSNLYIEKFIPNLNFILRYFALIQSLCWDISS